MNRLPVKLPDVGEGVTEAELVELNVKLGDMVREDDVIAAVMTDKATVEIPSLYAGKVVEIGGEIGERLAVGSDIVMIETEADGKSRAPAPAAEPAPAAVEAPAEEAPAAPAMPTPEPAPKPAAKPVPPVVAAAPRPEGQAPLASPSVRARAREGGVDLRSVSGSGPAGRITNEDLDAVFAAPTGGQARPSGRKRRTDTEEIHVIGMRRKIAERMALANERIPHITVVEEIDVSALEDLRATMNGTRGDKPKLTLLPYLIAALTRAVADHPEMNAHYMDDDGTVIRHGAVNAGIATMTDAGLVVPVLRNAEAMGLFETAGEILRLSEVARSGKATREELTGSTITITSLGPLGALVTTPIINHPEVSIIGVNRMAVRPMWDGSQFVPRKMMNISASFDHRVIDGWNAAVFIQRLKALLETPALIFVEE